MKNKRFIGHRQIIFCIVAALVFSFFNPYLPAIIADHGLVSSAQAITIDWDSLRRQFPETVDGKQA